MAGHTSSELEQFSIFHQDALCKVSRGTGILIIASDWVLSEEIAAAECEFDVRDVSPDLMDRLCRIVRAAENTDPEEKLTVESVRGLAIVPPES